jgi:hypothetical protein
MEMSQGNSLYSCLIRTKMPYLKNREQESSLWGSCMGVGTGGRIKGKGVRG